MGQAADGPSPRVDRKALDAVVRTLVEEHGEGIRVGLWVGGRSGAAWYASDAEGTFPAASAIKTSFLIELFARYSGALDRPPPGLEEVLREGHPAFAHFDEAQRAEIRAGLAGVSVRKLGGLMMGSVPASNLVYNAAASTVIALFGGPEGLTKAIRSRDPAFATIAVRRYMLADRHASGDNEATPAALAAVLRRLADRKVAGLDEATVEDIRRAVIVEDHPRRGRHFHKEGDLETDPLTHILSGWYESPGGEPIVYVVMATQPNPSGRPRAEAHRRLTATADALGDRILSATNPTR